MVGTRVPQVGWQENFASVLCFGVEMGKYRQIPERMRVVLSNPDCVCGRWGLTPAVCLETGIWLTCLFPHFGHNSDPLSSMRVTLMLEL